MSVEQESTEEAVEAVNEEVEATDLVAAEDGESEAVVPEYEPNLVYKVYDEEKEFPDWAKELVKSKDHEEALRTYLSKADAFDPLKEKYEERGQKLTDSTTKYDNTISKLTEYDHYIKQNALAPVFKEWGISDQQAIDYVANLLKMQDLPADERANALAQQNNVVSDWQNQQLQQTLVQQNQQLASQAHETSYQRVLDQPVVAEFGNKLEAVLGKGQMRALADQYGQAYYQQNGRDTTPDDAVRYVMETYKNLSTVAPVADGLAAAQTELEEGKPGGHIPRVGRAGGSTSPVRKKVRSLDDLRKLVESSDFK